VNVTGKFPPFIMDTIFQHLDKEEKYLLLLLQKNPQILESDYEGRNPLELLDPSTHTAVYLLILNARLRKDPGQISFAMKFAKSFVYSSSLREEFALLVHLLQDHNTSLSRSILVELAKQASQSQNLTVVHVPALLACLRSRRPLDAIPILNLDLQEFDSKCIDAKQFLLYYYYGGMVYLACKYFDRALEFLTMVLYAPTVLPSEIQLEAYKKLILASYIHRGKASDLPSHFQMGISKAIQSQAEVYIHLVSQLESFQVQRVQSSVLTHAEEFKKDGNFGLVKQSMAAMIRFRVQQLTKTYLTLSLADMERLVGPSGLEMTKFHSFEQLIVDMIENGAIHATICHKDKGMVYFKDDPRKYDQLTTSAEIHQQINKIQDLNRTITKTDREIATSQTYLAQTRQSARRMAQNT
jgi:COP9 signalosome complex subunit 3